MVETVGTKLRRARVSRELTLEDAARATKIRSLRLAELEGDVYTNFANLAYARGFLTSYGKYLSVDVRPYLDAFENTSTFGVDDYQYLSERPVGVYRAPRRVWRQRGAPRKRLVALGTTLGVFLITLCGWFLYINYLRLGDLNKLAQHQDSRARQPGELSPMEILARPIPSESPNPLIAASLLITPAQPAAAPAQKENAPAATSPATPAEIAVIEKPSTFQPPAVSESATGVSSVPETPSSPEPRPVPGALTAAEAEQSARQVVEARAATAVLRPAPTVAGHRLSAHASERPARPAFETAPPQPPARVKSFE